MIKKFRFWSITHKEWVCQPRVWFNSNGDLMIANSNPDKEGEYVIQQYTGLKDINNQEIYEGDIVTRTVCINCFDGTLRNDKKIVIYDLYKGFGFIEREIPFGWLWEIKGNIFETPELLQKNEKIT